MGGSEATCVDTFLALISCIPLPDPQPSHIGVTSFQHKPRQFRTCFSNDHQKPIGNALANLFFKD